MGRLYKITQEQFEEVQHYKRMFELNAELVRELCSAERDDVVYGFELGKMHSHLRDCFMGMLELESAIHGQQIATGKSAGDSTPPDVK